MEESQVSKIDFVEGKKEDASFSLYHHPISNLQPYKESNIPEIGRYISSPYAKNATEELRSITDEDSARKFKVFHFEFCTFSGVFSSRKKTGLLYHSGLLCIDFDHIEDIPLLKEKLLSDEYFNTRLLFRSPSGDGLKWVVDVDLNEWEHSRFYNAVYNYLVKNGYPEPDKSGSDVSRACFLPYDPDVYIGLYATKLTKKLFVPDEWIDPITEITQSPVVVSDRCCSEFTRSKEFTESKVQKVVQMIEQAKMDITSTYDSWYKIGFAFVSEFGERGREYFRRISQFNPKYKQTDVDRKYDNCLNGTRGGIGIGTFFWHAKDAGIDISNKKEMNINDKNSMDKIQNSDNGSLDFWNSGSEHPVASETDKLQKSITPQIQSVQNGLNWSTDEKNLPCFPQSVFDNLPPFAKKLVESFPSEKDRDWFLMGLLTCISVTLYNVAGMYNKVLSCPMLYFFVMAEAGMGKGAMVYCRQLVAPIHKERLRISEEQIKEYKQSQKNGSAVNEDEPKRRMLIIPANSSSAAVIQQLDNNGGMGLIFETECDVLSATLKSDFGDYSTLLRKGFHHEPIELSRRKDNEYRSIEHPMLAICLSGTPDQLQSLTPTADNGTFSRFAFYYRPFETEFGDVLVESSATNSSDTSLSEKYYQFGLQYKQMWEAFFRGGKYNFVIPQNLCDEFNTHFRAVNEDAVEEISHDMQGVVRRLAFISFRIMMILTSIRFMDETPNPSALAKDGKPIDLICSDEDFHIAIAMGDTLFYHTVYCYSHLLKNQTTGNGGVILKKADKMNKLLYALPDTFNKSTFDSIAKELGFSVSTACKWINSFIEDGRLERNGQNCYHKL